MFLNNCIGQVRHQSLIAAEYRVDSPKVGNYTYLVAYNFTDGSFESKDTLLGAKTSRGKYEGSYVRYDLGKNFIYRNRYVISGTGNVIDTKTKSLLMEESDDFVEALGDILLFHRANARTGKGFLLLDLNSKVYKFINNKEWNRSLRFSPGKKYCLSIDQSVIPYKIDLNDQHGQKITTLVSNAGHGPNTNDSQFPNVETFWLNDTVFIYAIHQTKYAAGKKIYASVTVRTFNINNLSDKIFAVIDSLGQGSRNGNFFRDGTGQLLYRTSDWQLLQLDTLQQQLLAYPFYEYGHGFAEENEGNKNGKVLTYKKVAIGRQWFSKVFVSNGIIAIEYGEPGSNPGYPKGIRTWSEQTTTWTTINIPWLCSAIGWIDRE